MIDLEALEALTEAATPGPWWFEDSAMCWRLHGVAGVIPAQPPIPEQVINHQILKAPKSGTPYAEYWPSEADGELIVAARNALPGLLEELRQLREQRDGTAGKEKIMSVILQRGDKIHLAIPFTAGNGTYGQQKTEAEVEAEHYIAFYLEQGIQVVRWSANNALTHPYVVAVFRD